MKVVKYVIGLVLAITSIGIVFGSINDISKEEIILEHDLTDYYNDEYSNMYHIEILDIDYFDKEFISIIFNDIEYKITSVAVNDYGPETFDFTFYTENLEIMYEYDTDSASLKDHSTNPIFDGSQNSVTFKVLEEQSGLIYTLLGLIPLIMVGGVITFMLYKKRNDL